MRLEHFTEKPKKPKYTKTKFIISIAMFRNRQYFIFILSLSHVVLLSNSRLNTIKVKRQQAKHEPHTATTITTYNKKKIIFFSFFVLHFY